MGVSGRLQSHVSGLDFKGEAFLEEVKKVYTAISTAILQTHSRTVSKARLHYSKSGAAESFSLHLY